MNPPLPRAYDYHWLRVLPGTVLGAVAVPIFAAFACLYLPARVF